MACASCSAASGSTTGISRANSSLPSRPITDFSRHRLPQPLGDLDQHLVAAGIAKRIVDLVEAIEVDGRERPSLPCRGAPPGARSNTSKKWLWFGRPVSTSSNSSRWTRCSLLASDRPRRLSCHIASAANHDEPDRDQRRRTAAADHHRGRRPLRLPTEPADDPPVAVEHRLHDAVASHGLGFEPQVLRVRSAAPARATNCGSDFERLGKTALQRFDRAAQRLPMLGLEPLVGLPRQRGADPGADDAGDDQNERQRRDHAQHRGLAPAPCAPGAAGAGPTMPGTSAAAGLRRSALCLLHDPPAAPVHATTERRILIR